jgi:MoxR-like ATPase
LDVFWQEDCSSLLARCYPHAIPEIGSQRNGLRNAFFQSLRKLDRNDSSSADEYYIDYAYFTVLDCTRVDEHHSDVTFSSPTIGNNTTITIPCGNLALNQSAPNFVETDGTRHVLKAMLQEHFADRNILLLSKKGEGNSANANRFAAMLGYPIHLFATYKDMSSLDLLVRGTTNAETGETCWEESPLIEAARKGHVCILDGIEKLRPDVLASLSSIVNDRELWLPDGRRLVRGDSTTTTTTTEDVDPRLVAIHPSFRLIALASTSQTNTSWLSEDVISMFSTILIPVPSRNCTKAILSSATKLLEIQDSEKVVASMLEFRDALTEEVASDCGVAPLSTRNMIRVMRLLSSHSTSQPYYGLYEALCSVLIADLLPPTQFAALDSLLQRLGITQKSAKRRMASEPNSQQQELDISVPRSFRLEALFTSGERRVDQKWSLLQSSLTFPVMSMS